MSYYYDRNREKLFKKAHDKYHNGGGKKKLLCIIKKNKEVIKKRERDIYKSMTDIERNEKIKKSLDRYYKLKSTI